MPVWLAAPHDSIDDTYSMDRDDLGEILEEILADYGRVCAAPESCHVETVADVVLWASQQPRGAPHNLRMRLTARVVSIRGRRSGVAGITMCRMEAERSGRPAGVLVASAIGSRYEIPG